jgi:hypothetical protein
MICNFFLECENDLWESLQSALHPVPVEWLVLLLSLEVTLKPHCRNTARHLGEKWACPQRGGKTKPSSSLICNVFSILFRGKEIIWLVTNDQCRGGHIEVFIRWLQHFLKKIMNQNENNSLIRSVQIHMAIVSFWSGPERGVVRKRNTVPSNRMDIFTRW